MDEDLITKHYKQLHTHCLIHATSIAQTLHRQSDIDDYVQQLLLHVFTKQHQYNPKKSSFVTFASFIINRKALDILRVQQGLKYKFFNQI